MRGWRARRFLEKPWPCSRQSNDLSGGIVGTDVDHVRILAPQISSGPSKSSSSLLAGVRRHFEGTDETHQSILVEWYYRPITPGLFRPIKH
jgi:hypothetical protein